MSERMRNRKQKKREPEFSKLILFVFGLIEIGVIVFTCYMVFLTRDLAPLAYLIPSTAVVGATGVKHYFQKARTENRIKLMHNYGIQPTAESFNTEY